MSLKQRNPKIRLNLGQHFLLWVKSEGIEVVSPVKYKYLPEAARLNVLVSELQFAPARRFRFDFADPVRMIAFEVEGGAFLPKGSRHTRGRGYVRDCEKYNLATVLGWRVFRYATMEQVRSFRHHRDQLREADALRSERLSAGVHTLLLN